MKRIFCADRVLSLVMAILMTIALLPTGASAAGAKTWAATGADAILDIAPAAIKVTESPLSRVAWNFRLHGWSGVGLDGTQLGQEGYYGAEILCSGSQVTYRAYTHQSGVKPVSAVAVEVHMLCPFLSFPGPAGRYRTAHHSAHYPPRQRSGPSNCRPRCGP